MAESEKPIWLYEGETEALIRATQIREPDGSQRFLPLHWYVGGCALGTIGGHFPMWALLILAEMRGIDLTKEEQSNETQTVPDAAR